MKGVGFGGKRYISIPGFRGYVTRKLNPWRREEKRLLREDKWQNKKHKEATRSHGLSTVVHSSPCLIPDNGRAAKARAAESSWITPERELQRMRNRCQTKIRGNRSLKQKLVSEAGSLHVAIEQCVSHQWAVVHKEA